MIVLPEFDKSAARQALRHDYLRGEAELVAAARAALVADWDAVQLLAQQLIERMQHASPSVRDVLLQIFPLSSSEGLALMRLAEAALRIPDDATLDRLLHDLLQHGDWHAAAQRARHWQAALASRLLEFSQWLERLADGGSLGDWFERAGHATIRNGARRAVALLSADFVLGETIGQALLASDNADQYRYSFDMLGEAALTYPDASAYFEAYKGAIEAVALSRRGSPADKSVSIKLSALHPRYEWRNLPQLRHELLPLLAELVLLARQHDVPLTLDAEEADRLELSLDLFQYLFRLPQLADWSGLGLALQAYSRRALAQIEWLAQLARGSGRRIPLRLVKGAYWDSEIKRAQLAGQASYPVFTRKRHSEIAYYACAAKLLQEDACFDPQFATHNAYTAAYVLHLAQQSGRRVEFQRLHGMGEALHRQLVQQYGMVSRVYAPVGELKRLLPYLVRRLLENGANNSFVNQLSAGRLNEAFFASLLRHSGHLSAGLPEPQAIFPNRRVASGGSMADIDFLSTLQAEMATWAQHVWHAAPIINGHALEGEGVATFSPLDQRQQIGVLTLSSQAALDAAFAAAQRAQLDWAAAPVETRAACLERLAGLLQVQRGELLALLQLEAGKTLADALAELREAIDYCLWYAQQARGLFGQPLQLDAVAGEANQLSWHARGCFVCISPWNFPLAIFIGQVTAALAAGNTVLAKPSRQTCLIAQRAVQLAHQAGIPVAALQFVPGEGAAIGDALVHHPAVAGVAFTGSAAVAKRIQRLLAEREDRIVPLIAETSGLNAMIADSSAHLEQLVADVLQSAFNSAGQRCSALRILCLQQEIAAATIEMLREAMHTLRIGDVRDIGVDIGPLISADARQQLLDYLAGLDGRLLAQLALSAELPPGAYFAPQMWEIDIADWPKHEAFGPLLHIVRWRQGELPQLIEHINRSGFGLTLALHSRVPSHIELVQRSAHVGNLYVNRNQIGAVVGSQPFGGEGRSGTGPKAGGPHYLQRFALERVVSVNTAAVGGMPELYRDE